MIYRFSTDVRVRLPETDVMGVVFHGIFLTYFDVARTDYLRKLGLLQRFQTGRAMNLIVHASADFRSPARFDDVLEVRCRVSRIGRTSVTFEFRVVLKKGRRLVAEGRSVHALIHPKTWRPIRVPESFRKPLRRFEGKNLSEES